MVTTRLWRTVYISRKKLRSCTVYLINERAGVTAKCNTVPQLGDYEHTGTEIRLVDMHTQQKFFGVRNSSARIDRIHWLDNK